MAFPGALASWQVGNKVPGTHTGAHMQARSPHPISNLQTKIKPSQSQVRSALSHTKVHQRVSCRSLLRNCTGQREWTDVGKENKFHIQKSMASKVSEKSRQSQADRSWGSSTVTRPALSQMFKGALPGETERCEVLWSHMRKLEEAVFWPVCVLTVH